MVYILIASGVLSLVIVAAGLTVLVRNIMAYVRTSRQFQRRTVPTVELIVQTGVVIQNRALAVTDRAQLLQRRLYLLSFTLNQSRILAAAIQRALEPINRARHYVGL